MRQGLRDGGEWVELRYRQRWSTRAEFVILWDVSGSMREHESRFFGLVHALESTSRSTRVFAFSTRIEEITGDARRYGYRRAAAVCGSTDRPRGRWHQDRAFAAGVSGPFWRASRRQDDPRHLERRVGPGRIRARRGGAGETRTPCATRGVGHTLHPPSGISTSGRCPSLRARKYRSAARPRRLRVSVAPSAVPGLARPTVRGSPVRRGSRSPTAALRPSND